MRGYFGIALWAPKSTDNYGTALRSAYVFDASLVQVVGRRFKRQPSDVFQTHRHVPTFEVNDIDPPYDCQIVAVEIAPGRSVALPDFQHPERALYVFGPEDGSVPKHVIDRAQHVVTIPGRACLNLASAVTIVLYDRAVKRGEDQMPLAMPVGSANHDAVGSASHGRD